MITIELYGVPRLRAGRGRVTLEAQTLGEALLGLGRECPGLEGTVLRLGIVQAAYRLNLNGDRFVSDPETRLTEGDALLLLAADAGG
jgi:molybdopterin synthase sulfur carrier subunit